MRKIAIIALTLLVSITATAKIHIQYGFGESDLLNLVSNKDFVSHTRVDSSNKTFVFETSVRYKNNSSKTSDKTVSGAAIFDRTLTINYSLQQLENYRSFVLVFNDEKAVIKDGVEYYDAVLLPRRKNLTLAYIMQFLSLVQDKGLNQAAEAKKIEDAKHPVYSDTTFDNGVMVITITTTNYKNIQMSGYNNRMPEAQIMEFKKRRFENAQKVLDSLFPKPILVGDSRNSPPVLPSDGSIDSWEQFPTNGPAVKTNVR